MDFTFIFSVIFFYSYKNGYLIDGNIDGYWILDIDGLMDILIDGKVQTCSKKKLNHP